MEIQKISPIRFKANPVKTEQRDGWNVALSYGEQRGTFLIDLSHRPKWDLQSSNLARFKPFGIKIPESPGQRILSNGILINRMNKTQCHIWNLASEKSLLPRSPHYTDITDGYALLGVTGPSTLDVMERVTNLDLCASYLVPPCLLQGPVLHIPCQVVLLRRSRENSTIVFSFSRGYGQAIVDAMLHSAADLWLRPGGELDLKL